MTITKKDKDPTRAERKLKKRKLEEAIPNLPGDVGETDLQDVSTQAIENSYKKRKFGKSSIHNADFQRDGENKSQQKKNKEEKKGKRAVKDIESHADEMVKSNDKALDSDQIGELRSEKMESIHGKSEREIEVSGDSTACIDEDPPAKKSKKERKAERKAAEAAQAAHTPIEDMPVASGEGTQPGKSKHNNRNREKKRKGGDNNEASEKAVGKAPRFIVFIGKLDGHFACSGN